MTIPTFASGVKVLTPEECDQIIQLCSPLTETSLIIENNNTKTKNTNLRKSKSIGLPSDDPRFESIKPLLLKVVDAIMGVSQEVFYCTLAGVDPIQFAAYESGDYYQDHIDSSMDMPRAMSASVLLSSPLDFKNGDLCFKNLNPIDEKDKMPEGIPVPLEQGEIVVFPSLLLHQVTPVTKGTRYSLVLWSFTEEMSKTRGL